MALNINEIEEIDDDEEDALGVEYVKDKLERRARMASTAFIVGLAGGIVVIAVGLFVEGAARRIEAMGTFLSIFFGAIFTVIIGYMGLGSYDLRNSSMGQGPYSRSAARRIVYPRGDVAGGQDYGSDFGGGARRARRISVGADDQDAGDEPSGDQSGLDQKPT